MKAAIYGLMICFISVAACCSGADAAVVGKEQSGVKKTDADDMEHGSDIDFVRHIVEPGEDLFVIMTQRYNVARQDLELFTRLAVEANRGVADMNRLFPGQEILVPFRSAGHSQIKKQDVISVYRIVPVYKEEEIDVADVIEHTVRRGEYLSRILWGYGLPDDLVYSGTVRRVMQWSNPGIEDFSRLEAGDVIKIPRGLLVLRQEVQTVARASARQPVHEPVQPAGEAVAAPEYTAETEIYHADPETERSEVRVPKQVSPPDMLEHVDVEDVIEHRVRSGEFLSRILWAYGIPDDRVYAVSVRALMKRANPEIEDLDMLEVGDILRIPKEIIVFMSPSVHAPLKAPPVRYYEPDIKKQRKLISAVMAFLEAEDASRDKSACPTGGRTNLMLDFSRFPLYRFPWGRTVLVDYGNHIPDGLKKIVTSQWEDTVVASIARDAGLEQVLDEIFNVSGFFKVEKDGCYTLNRDNVQINVSGKWVIFKDNLLRDVFIVNLVDEDKNRLPQKIKSYFSDIGVNIVEIKDGLLMGPEKTAASKNECNTERIASDVESVIDAVLAFAAPGYRINHPIKIFHSADNWFSFDVVADRAFFKNGVWNIIDIHGLPEKTAGVVRSQGIKLLEITDRDPVSVVEFVLDFCNVSYLKPPALIKKASLNILISGFLVKTGTGDVLMTRQRFGDDVCVLFSDLGIRVIEF